MREQRHRDDVLQDLLQRLEKFALLAAATMMAKQSNYIAPDKNPADPLSRADFVAKLDPATRR